MLTLLHAAWNASLGIRIAILANVGLLIFALIALPFDHRVILGLNPWIKPIKFDLSVIIFLITIGALLSALGQWQQQQAIIGWGIGIAMVIENTLISVQSLRGVRSHMNYTTAHDAAIFAAMGIFIALSSVLSAWLLALLCMTPTLWPAPAAWGARLGLATLLAGSLEGIYMVSNQAHTVGAPDGTPGLPFVNWSLSHGDLRAAHFFALHALQLLPLIGYAISRTPLPRTTQITTVAVAFTLYFAATFALFRQALRGTPFLG